VSQRKFWMRWRVRVGYPVAIAYIVLASPTPRSIVSGAMVAAVGLVIRGASSGYLRKDRELARSGPYAYMRNPLYFGSAMLAAGFIVAGRSWIAGILVGAYFAIFYYAVMRNEEQDLRVRFGVIFDEYAARVPLFFPKWPMRRARSTSPSERFSRTQYLKNREYKAAIGTIAGLGLLCVRMWFRTRWGI
jgi:protein-S-isoprenylcysteine O-methyltransferase Ste14